MSSGRDRPREDEVKSLKVLVEIILDCLFDITSLSRVNISLFQFCKNIQILESSACAQLHFNEIKTGQRAVSASVHFSLSWLSSIFRLT